MDVEMQDPSKENQNERATDTAIQVEPDNERRPPRKPPLLLFWMLIPFFRRFFLYFTLIAIYREGYINLPTILIAILKCSPILTLTVFIFRQHNSFRLLWRNRYSLLLFIGHLFLITGAVIVLFSENNETVFLIGKFFLMVAWCFYIAGFELKPFASRLFVRSVIAAAFAYSYLYIGGINKANLVVQIGGGFYIAVLFAMQWRAWARVTYLDLAHGRWYEFFGGLGASLLVVSEGISLIAKYLIPSQPGYKLPGADYWTEVTLYLGNLLIALSVVDGPNIVWPPERAMHQKKLQEFKQSLGKADSCLKVSLIRIADWFFS